jgi:hypothetical protein
MVNLHAASKNVGAQSKPGLCIIEGELIRVFHLWTVFCCVSVKSGMWETYSSSVWENQRALLGPECKL